MPSLAACFSGMWALRGRRAAHIFPIPQSAAPLGLTMNKYTTFRVPEYSRMILTHEMVPLCSQHQLPNFSGPLRASPIFMSPFDFALLGSFRLESKTPTTEATSRDPPVWDNPHHMSSGAFFPNQKPWNFNMEPGKLRPQRSFSLLDRPSAVSMSKSQSCADNNTSL